MSAPDRTLLLLRHAKSDYPSGVADHDRPLAPRGVREAALAGDWIRANLPDVEVVLCSSATRTRQTLARTGLADHADVHVDDDLYDTTPGTVIGLVNGIDDDVSALLVVGHEPTMSGLALGLAANQDGDVAHEILAKYPTSAIAVLRTQKPWSQLELGCAELIGFHVPR